MLLLSCHQVHMNTMDNFTYANIILANTPQPLYYTIVGIQVNFHFSYPNCVILRVKCIAYIGKGVLNNPFRGQP